MPLPIRSLALNTAVASSPAASALQQVLRGVAVPALLLLQLPLALLLPLRIILVTLFRGALDEASYCRHLIGTAFVWQRGANHIQGAKELQRAELVLKLRRAPVSGPAYSNANEIDVSQKKEDTPVWLAFCCSMPRPAPMPVA